ncbi:unnamed protein product [Ranitomeya imitator]|uniref:Macro domain-containing protein n=1 Tax=Ranitomeya imitator TaxID=111125 RepID=A0ABN9KPB4_9NEOB|nr:unnamed protein product [Ranitomeya imitator]
MPSIASGYEYPPPPTLVTRSETGYTEEIEDFQEMYSNVIPGPHIHDVLFRIGTGDLTRQHVGAIVNAANNQLHHAGGLAAMISQKGGPMIQEESNSYIQTYGQVETGQVAATRAGQLPCQYVIHAVGPRYNPTNIPRSQQLLTEAVQNAILYASSVPPDTMPQRTMAIPLISAGIFQYPRKDAAMVIVSAIERCIQENPIKLEEVRFVLDSHLAAHQATRSLTVTEPPVPLLQQMPLVPILPPPPPAPESVISEFEEDDVKPTPDRPNIRLEQRRSRKTYSEGSEEIGTKQNPLNCMLANARSLTNKMEELEAEISTGNFDIVGITETWLDESYDWAVNLQGYSLFRKDRKNRRGGGVCLYVKSCLKSTLREDISEGNEDVESIWVEIHGGKNGNKILIGVCYKPPNITETMESLLLKQIDEAATHNEVLVMGDFNYPDINWETETCETHKGNRFLLITKKNYLSQLVQNPTRGAALLDLILS